MSKSNIFGATLRTKVHTYQFQTRSSAEAAAYGALVAQLHGTPGMSRCMESHGGALHYQPSLDGMEVELTYMHSDQWAAKTPGGKEIHLHDWAQGYDPGRTGSSRYMLKQGYYLDITPEMIAARANTVKCGYCGHCEPKEGAPAFCTKCAGSAHLEESDLYMTRMVPLSVPFGAEKMPLADDEGYVVDAWRAAQVKRQTADNDKKRADVIASAEKAIKKAQTERDGLLWLLDRGFNTDNVIYYDHRSVFSWGWRSPLSETLAADVAAALVDFPFDYEIKKA